jgi:hypothetical protein
MAEFKCPLCGSGATIKDNDRFCSLLCSCRILIFYYEGCIDVEIKKIDYDAYKKRQVQNGKRD